MSSFNAELAEVVVEPQVSASGGKHYTIIFCRRKNAEGNNEVLLGMKKVRVFFLNLVLVSRTLLDSVALELANGMDLVARLSRASRRKMAP